MLSRLAPDGDKERASLRTAGVGVLAPGIVGGPAAAASPDRLLFPPATASTGTGVRLPAPRFRTEDARWSSLERIDPGAGCAVAGSVGEGVGKACASTHQRAQRGARDDGPGPASSRRCVRSRGCACRPGRCGQDEAPHADEAGRHGRGDGWRGGAGGRFARRRRRRILRCPPRLRLHPPPLRQPREMAWRRGTKRSVGPRPSAVRTVPRAAPRVGSPREFALVGRVCPAARAAECDVENPSSTPAKAEPSLTVGRQAGVGRTVACACAEGSEGAAGRVVMARRPPQRRGSRSARAPPLRPGSSALPLRLFVAPLGCLRLDRSRAWRQSELRRRLSNSRQQSFIRRSELCERVQICQRGIGTVEENGRRSGKAAPSPRRGCSPARRAGLGGSGGGRIKPSVDDRRPGEGQQKIEPGGSGQGGSHAGKELVIGRLLARPCRPMRRARSRRIPAHRATRRSGLRNHAPTSRTAGRPAPRRGARSPRPAPPPRPGCPARSRRAQSSSRRPPSDPARSRARTARRRPARQAGRRAGRDRQPPEA